MKQLETGKQGLTRQVRDYLKMAQKLYGIFWQRNQQGLGNRKGLPDFYVFIPIKQLATLIAIELKTNNRKLTVEQERIKNEIETGNGLYYICHSLEDVDEIFKHFVYYRVEIQY